MATPLSKEQKEQKAWLDTCRERIARGESVTYMGEIYTGTKDFDRVVAAMRNKEPAGEPGAVPAERLATGETPADPPLTPMPPELTLDQKVDAMSQQELTVIIGDLDLPKTESVAEMREMVRNYLNTQAAPSSPPS